VIDVQTRVVAGAHDRSRIVGNIATVVERARTAGVPVIWIRHGDDDDLVLGSDGWRIVDELDPKPGEPVIDKRFGDAFEATGLEAALADLGVGRVVVTGAQTDACIRSTLHGALVRGYDTLLVGDGHTTEDLSRWGAPPPGQVIAHTNLYWKYQTAPGRTTGVVEADTVTF
jgi:nicotinamidase-related amidase